MGPKMPLDARISLREPLRVSLLALPEATLGSLTGMFDTLSCFPLLGTFDDSVPTESPFEVELVAAGNGLSPTASGIRIPVHRSIDDATRTDIAIVPSVLVEGGIWAQGRHPDLVAWLDRVHAEGGLVCSACSGVLLIAETGLLSGREATIHPAYAPTFRSNFPDVRLRVEETLVTAGEREELVMAGASASWHDLVLYLVARYVGPTAAQAVAKFLLLQWHTDGQGPYVPFDPPTDHGDAIVLAAQEWLRKNYAVAAPVTELVERSGLPERTFKRRFARSTGHAPIAYVQRVRVEEAKRRLERTSDPVDAVSYTVGYEDPASFRRLFKRITGVSPGVYRRKLQLPAFARMPSGVRRNPAPSSRRQRR
jgi:transcriptional regulator GlxA family with amidase domain